MRISILAFGKLKTPGLRDCADYYSRILRPWVNFEEVELKPLPVSDKSASTRQQIQEKEGKLVLEFLKKLPARSRLILLDERGKALPTEGWVTEVQESEDQGIAHLVFCIGSSLGFSAEVRQKAQGALSLGPQTVSHELARVILLEQIYRAYSVMKGHPYHNAGA